MVFFEYKGDLFNAAKDLHLKNDDLLFAHCISSDFALGAGIAKVFRDKYKVKEQLPHIPIGDRWYGNGYCLITKGELTVANLVTK